MKKAYCFIVLLAGISTLSFSQPGTGRQFPHRGQPGNNLKSLKEAFVIKQLSLTSDEAQKFWPVYFNYTNDLRRTRQGQNDDVLALEENVLNLRKKYRSDLKRILVSDDRVNKALTVDRDFMNVVRKELQQRANGRTLPPKDIN